MELGSEVDAAEIRASPVCAFPPTFYDRLRKFHTAAFLALVLISCADKTATYPMKVEPYGGESSALGQLDPRTSTLEEHIYVLSPLKAATRDSVEYRGRLEEGFRHPRTLQQGGGDYVYVPPRESGESVEGHEYALDRRKGRFLVTNHWGGGRFQSAYFHNEDGWWVEGHKLDFFGADESK